MKAVWLASSAKDCPLEVISDGPFVVVCRRKRAGPSQAMPPTGASPEGEEAEGQTVAVAGNACDRTSPVSRSIRKPSQERGSQPAETKARPEAYPCDGPGAR